MKKNVNFVGMNGCETCEPPVSMDYRPRDMTNIHYQIQEYKKAGGELDPKLQLCADLEGYVIHLMMESFRAYMPSYFDDMYEEAMIEILKHADKYDPKKGAKTSFFSTRIMHAMYKWISENVMGSTTHYADAERKINRELRGLEDITSLSTDQVYDLLGGKLPKVTIEKVLRMKVERREAKHYAIESGAWNDLPYQQSMPKYYDPQEYVEQTLLCEQMLGCVNALDTEDKEIIRAYFGLDGTPLPAALLAKKYGTTQRKMMKRITRILQKLRKEMTGSVNVQ